MVYYWNYWVALNRGEKSDSGSRGWKVVSPNANDA